jgi:hypothetical protein
VTVGEKAMVRLDGIFCTKAFFSPFRLISLPLLLAPPFLVGTSVIYEEVENRVDFAAKLPCRESVVCKVHLSCIRTIPGINPRKSKAHTRQIKAMRTK